MIELGLLVVALAVLAAVMLLLGFALATRKAVRQIRQRRRRRAEAAIRPYLLELLAAEGDMDDADGDADGGAGGAGNAEPSEPDVADVLRSLSPRDWRVLEPMTITFLGKVRGDAHDRMVDLLVERGTVDRMVKRLKRPGAVGRASAAEVLGLLGVTQASDALLERLDDNDADVRRVAAHALAATPTPQVIERLLACLDGPRPLPFGLVVTDLLGIGRDVVPSMMRALGDGSRQARAGAAEIVGLLGSLPAAAPLERTLADQNSTQDLRIRAARALGRVGSPGSVDALVDAVGPDEDPPVRAAAAQALGDLDDPEAVDALVSALWAPQHEVASAAAAALAALGTEGAVALEAVRDQAPGAAEADALPPRYAAAALATLNVSGAGRGATVAAGA